MTAASFQCLYKNSSDPRPPKTGPKGDPLGLYHTAPKGVNDHFGTELLQIGRALLFPRSGAPRGGLLRKIQKHS